MSSHGIARSILSRSKRAREQSRAAVRQRQPNSLWIYIISLRTQVHSQIKIHGQIDRCRPQGVTLKMMNYVEMMNSPKKKNKSQEDD